MRSGCVGVLRVVSRGPYSCYWTHSSLGKRRWGCCWLSFVALVTVVTLAWLLIWMALYNSRDDMNTKLSLKISTWVNWFMVMVIISSVLAIYTLLLLVFGIIQYALKEPLDLHWVHKVFLFLGLFIVAAGLVAISKEWRIEWPTVPLLLQAIAPFLQLTAVGSLTLVSWSVFKSLYKAQRKGSRVLIMVTWALVSLAVFLCPLIIRTSSPCIREGLPPKPLLIGHRGAPMMAPENTMMSFRRSLECNVTAFETDVLISKDGQPFLMHDHESLRRTTDVAARFKSREKNASNSFTWREIRKMSAGQWFPRNDPLEKQPSLSEWERSEAANQSVPLLRELLDLANHNNVSIIFDLKAEIDNNATNTLTGVNYTVHTILESGIPQQLIWWLPPIQRGAVMSMAPGFTHFFQDIEELKHYGGNHLNVKYNNLSSEGLRWALSNESVWVNTWVVNESWLFSLMWCLGVNSVTTHNCHRLQQHTHPDWLMKPMLYDIIWICADVLSFLLMVALLLLHRKKRARRQIFRLEPERAVPLLAL